MRRQTAWGFAQKVANDWVMNFAGMLAYNVLGSVLPIVLTGLTVFSYFLTPARLATITRELSTLLPSNLRSLVDITSALATVSRNSGLLTIISLAALVWSGSNLFGAMENCFCIIYRTRERSFFRQKVMSVSMALLFVALIPVLVVASSLASLVGNDTSAVIHLNQTVSHVAVGTASVVGSWIIAWLFFLIIYRIVPNRVLTWDAIWRGALSAATGIVVIDQIFPLYAALFMKNITQQYGSALGLAIIFTFWCWLFSVVVLLGAEINAFALGMRATSETLPAIMQRHSEPAP